MPPAHETASVRSIHCAPVPVLALDTLSTWASAQDFATVSFDYAGHSLPAHSSTTLLQTTGGEVVQIKRDADVERKRLTELQQAGFRKIRADRVFGPAPFPADMLGPEDNASWPSHLTAADTVIHYGPWWNPAVENQATDRAHRLGQSKPVFVYKLITGGSVEEKIVAMQAQKAALAEAILSEDAAGAVKFSAEDIEALFEPIPAAPAVAATTKSRSRRTGT